MEAQLAAVAIHDGAIEAEVERQARRVGQLVARHVVAADAALLDLAVEQAHAGAQRQLVRSAGHQLGLGTEDARAREVEQRLRRRYRIDV